LARELELGKEQELEHKLEQEQELQGFSSLFYDFYDPNGFGALFSRSGWE